MEVIKSFFARIGSAIASLFIPTGRKKAIAALGQAESLVQAVLPVIEAFAAATPNKADDEVVAIVKLLGRARRKPEDGVVSRLARTYGLSVYDASYLELARRLFQRELE